ncbi:MAG TPA: hypothetical protein VFX50_14105 [Gemmatimonadales bacterium]|nr:hypothetical protein [Gemmatimonadales bacterium]
MPIRTASVSRQLEKNGLRLHQAMLMRIQSRGAEHEPSEEERALMAEREALKGERARRQEEASHPHRKASTVVRTHHAEAKHKDAKPKAKKEKEAKPGAKAKPTRAEKQANKAAALAAAKKSAKKPAPSK